jgi:hypothetical protein
LLLRYQRSAAIESRLIPQESNHHDHRSNSLPSHSLLPLRPIAAPCPSLIGSSIKEPLPLQHLIVSSAIAVTLSAPRPCLNRIDEASLPPRSLLPFSRATQPQAPSPLGRFDLRWSEQTEPSSSPIPRGSRPRLIAVVNSFGCFSPSSAFSFSLSLSPGQ